MGDGWEMGIVSFVGVCHGAVGQRSHDDATSEVARGDSCLFGTSLCSDKLDHQPARFEEGA